MKANGECNYTSTLIVLCDGVDVSTGGGCVAADSEKGQALLVVTDANGEDIPGDDAELGSLVAAGCQVKLFEGAVAIEIDPAAETQIGCDKIREEVAATYKPIPVYEKTAEGLVQKFEF